MNNQGGCIGPWCRKGLNESSLTFFQKNVLGFSVHVIENKTWFWVMITM